MSDHNNKAPGEAPPSPLDLREMAFREGYSEGFEDGRDGWPSNPDKQWEVSTARAALPLGAPGLGQPKGFGITPRSIQYIKDWAATGPGGPTAPILEVVRYYESHAGAPGKGMEETGIIRKALESALAGVWDGHYSGTGVTVEYAQAVDAEVKEAIKILDGDPSASRPLRDAKRVEELGELAWEPHARALRDVMEREGIEVVCLGPRWEAKFHDLHEPEGKDSE
jgi:hypothetical protein